MGGKSPWARLRKAATEAGRLHADGGDDRRQEFASRGADVRDAYDKGYNNHIQELAEIAERQRHPLRQLRNRMNILADRHSQNLPVQGELISAIHEVLDYLLDQEDRR